MSQYHSQHLGKSEFYFWYGQVVGGSEWEDNHAHKIHKRDESEGWGYRVKVAIMGSDPRIVTDGVAKNSELQMAEVMLPTTGGGGIGGPIATPSIGNNSFVVGFYKDGVNAREPIVMGVLPNISQSRTLPYNTTEQFRYDATLGIFPTDVVSTSLVYKEDDKINEAFNPHGYHASHYDQYLSPRLYKIRIPGSHRCEDELSVMEGYLQDAMNVMNAAYGNVSDLKKGLDNIIDRASNLVAAIMKILVTKMREIAIHEFEKIAQFIINVTPLNLKNIVNDKIERETNFLSCIFSLIIAGLLELAKKFVSKLLKGDSGQSGGAVSSTLCVVNNAIGELVTNVFGKVTSAIDKALKAIGAIGNIAGNILSALDFIFGIFKILTCQENYKCPTVRVWNYWYGMEYPERGGSFKNSNTSRDSSDAVRGGASNCDLGPIDSGPPNIRVLGGNPTGIGSIFTGNPVISPSGQLIAVDIINSGSDAYETQPILIVQQNTGNGNGAVLEPLINPETNEIENVVILDTGVGYLQSPNGGTGAGGIQFSLPGDTVIFSDGAYSVYSSNQNVPVRTGDLIYLPPATTIQIYNEVGELVQNATSLGIEPVSVETSGIFTTPVSPVPGINTNSVETSGVFDTPVSPVPGINTNSVASYPNSSNKYPVILELNETYIKDSGFGYQNNDPIVIEPSNGTELKPNYNNGALVSVDVISSGIGFTDMPKVYIKSDTGFNAQLIPILNVVRIGDLSEEEQNKEIFQTGVIEVVDCVGIVPPKKKFDIVPQ